MKNNTSNVSREWRDRKLFDGPLLEDIVFESREGFYKHKEREWRLIDRGALRRWIEMDDRERYLKNGEVVDQDYFVGVFEYCVNKNKNMRKDDDWSMEGWEIEFQESNYRSYVTEQNTVVISTSVNAVLDLEEIRKVFPNCDYQNSIIFFNGERLKGDTRRIEELHGARLSYPNELFGALNDDGDPDDEDCVLYSVKCRGSFGLEFIECFVNGDRLLIKNRMKEGEFGLFFDEQAKENESEESVTSDWQEREIQDQHQDAIDSQGLGLLLRSDEVQCAHGGKVQYITAEDSMKFNNENMVYEADLMQAKIIGCSNNVPCQNITMIPRTALSQIRFNNKNVLLKSAVPSILTQSGSPLKVVSVSKDVVRVLGKSQQTFSALNNEGELESFLEYCPIYSINFKQRGQEDCLPIYECQFVSDDRVVKEFNCEGKQKMCELDFEQDFKVVSDSNQEFKDYGIFTIALRLQCKIIRLVILAEKKIPSFYSKLKQYEKYEYKDYGVGYFMEYIQENSLLDGQKKEGEELKKIIAPRGAKKMIVVFNRN